MILQNIKIRYSLLIILFLFIAHVLYMALADIALLKKIEVAEEDMRKIEGAIGAYYCGWSEFPISDDIFTSTSVYHQRYCDDPNQKIDSNILVLLEELSPQNRVEYLEQYLIIKYDGFLANPDDCELESVKGFSWTPYRDLERGRLYSYRKLTTPQAYLKSIPTDPFSKDPPFLYRYGAIMEEGKHFWQFHWVLLGNGPDGDVDIKPEYIAIDEEGDLVIYEKYPFEGKPGSFWDFVYDPTNGAQSNGDMVLSSIFF